MTVVEFPMRAMTFLSAILSLIQWSPKLFSREGRDQQVKLTAPREGD
jgi:hypothetical protein